MDRKRRMFEIVAAFESLVLEGIVWLFSKAELKKVAVVFAWLNVLGISGSGIYCCFYRFRDKKRKKRFYAHVLIVLLGLSVALVECLHVNKLLEIEVKDELWKKRLAWFSYCPIGVAFIICVGLAVEERNERSREQPRVSNVKIRGDVIVGATIEGVGEYTGGEEGDSTYEWWCQNESGERALVTRGTNMYSLTTIDIGCRMLFVYSPVDSEGRKGKPVSVISNTVVQGEIILKSLKIIGMAIVGATLQSEIAYSSCDEGYLVFWWCRKLNMQADEEKIPAATSSTYLLGNEDEGCFLTLYCVPMKLDGTPGRVYQSFPPFGPVTAAPPTTQLDEHTNDVLRIAYAPSLEEVDWHLALFSVPKPYSSAYEEPKISFSLSPVISAELQGVVPGLLCIEVGDKIQYCNNVGSSLSNCVSMAGWREERYNPPVLIGKGSNGNIFMCTNSQSELVVAVKQISFEKAREGFSGMREITALRSLDHPNIVRLLRYNVTKEGVNLVLEYLDYSLDRMNLAGPVDPDLTKKIMFQLLKGVSHCHSKKISHRDLKPENLLLDLKSETIIKITDFGHSRLADAPSPVFSTDVTTYQYSAPEILLRLPINTTSSDMWSVGCIFAEMVLGEPLFQGNSDKIVLRKITSVRVVTPELTQACLDVIGEKQVPRRKVLADQYPKLASHGANCLELLENMLSFKHDDRISASDALNHPYFEDFQPEQ